MNFLLLSGSFHRRSYSQALLRFIAEQLPEHQHVSPDLLHLLGHLSPAHLLLTVAERLAALAAHAILIIDTRNGAATARRIASMSYQRVYHNSVVLPNGQVVGEVTKPETINYRTRLRTGTTV